MEDIKILALGDIIWDVYPDRKCMGGAALNFAAHVAKNNVKSYMLSCLGDDPLGHEAIEVIRSYNVNDKYISFNDKKTGQCIVSLDENKIPTFSIIEDVAFDYLVLDEEIFNERFDALSFGSVTYRGKGNYAQVKRIIDAKICKNLFFDINLRAPFFDHKTIVYTLKNCNILKVSEEELSYIVINILNEKSVDYQSDIKTLCSYYENIELVLLTLGGEGSYAYERNKDLFTYQEAFKVEVVSTVGAGDSFGATFLVNYLKGDSIKDCLYKANKAAAEVVSKMEAI